jgi:hypothetical protein
MRQTIRGPEMNTLFTEILAELRGIRKDLREQETRQNLIGLMAEPMIDRNLSLHWGHVRGALGRIYDQAKESGNQSIVDAVDNAPIRLLPDEHKNNENR